MSDLRAILAARTPGRWQWWTEDRTPSLIADRPDDNDPHIITAHVCEACRARGAKCLGPNDADARAIVAAVNVIDAALDVVDAARALTEDEMVIKRGLVPAIKYLVIRAALAAFDEVKP